MQNCSNRIYNFLAVAVLDQANDKLFHKRSVNILDLQNWLLCRLGKKNEFITKKRYIQKKLLEFLSHLIHKYSFDSHHDPFLFKHLIIQIYLRQLNNPTKSWYILNNFYEAYNKISISQKFYIFCMFQELQEKLKKDDKIDITPI